MPYADGTILVDTEINSDGMRAGTKEVESAVRRMAASTNDLGEKAKAALNKQMDALVELSDKYDEQTKKVDELRKKTLTLKEIEKNLNDAKKAKEEYLAAGGDKEDQYYQDISQRIQQLESQYGKSSEKAVESTNEFKKELESTLAKIKELEDSGKWFGDEEYDNAIADLDRIQQAVRDYKKELTSPTESANPFDMDTLAGKIRQAEIELNKLVEAGKGLGDVDFNEKYHELAMLKDEAKKLTAELAKTPEQLQKEADAQSAKTAKEQAQLDALNQKLEETRAKEVQAIMEAERLKNIGNNAEISCQDIVDLNNELMRLKLRQADLSKAGLGLGFEEFDQNAVRISEINSLLREYEASLHRVDNSQESVKGSAGKMSQGFRKADKNAKKLGKSINGTQYGMGKMVAQSMIMSIVFSGISTVVNSVKEGFTNLAKHSGSTNASISMLWSSLERLKNSLTTAFAPILDVVAPILTRFIDMLSTAATYVSMFFSHLSGKSSYTKALAVQKDYAASLEDTAESAKDAADAVNGYLSPLDDINKFTDQSSSSSGTGTSGGDNEVQFEEVPIDTAELEKIKSILENFFSPFKEAWELEGMNTIEAAEYALTSLGILAESIGISFGEVWTNGTGTEMLATELQILQGILNIIGNIDSGIDDAWNRNEVGTQIIQNAADAFQEVLDSINQIVWATEDWSENLDFYPLLESIAGLFEELAPLIEGIGNWLTKLYEGIVLPFVKWLLETAIPGLLDKVTEFLEFLNENQWIIEVIGALLLAAFSAGKIVPLITTIIGAIKGIIAIVAGAGGLSGVIGLIVSALGGPLTIAIVAAIALLILLVTNWDKVKSVMSQFDTWLQGLFVKDWEKQFGSMGQLLNSFFANVKNIWNGIKQIFGGIITFVKGVFSGNWKMAWQGLVNIFKGIWNTIVAIAKSPLNILIGVVNKFLSTLETGVNSIRKTLNNFKIPDWVPGFGGKGFNLSMVSFPRIPYLASGAVIPPNKEFMAVLGDQKHGNNIEAPESLIRKIVREESGGKGNTYEVVAKVGRKELFRMFIDEAKIIQQQTGKNPLELA